MALIHTPEKIELGVSVPAFELKGIDGKIYRQSDFLNSKPLVFMFICNHCPYVKAIEDRLITLGQDLKRHGINVVGICSNDEVNYPDDSFENLKKRATEKNYPFTYLHDATQSTARAFGAVCTPDFFIYDGNGKLAWRGRLDDSWKEPLSVTQRELYTAALDLLNQRPLSGIQTPSMGCSIKWLKNG